jgi:hypothetical protein
MSLFPILASTPGNPVSYNPNIAETFSWIPIQGAGRELYAKATYDVNYAAETGQNGASYFTGNSVLSTGQWYAIQFIADTVFDTLSSNWTGPSVGSTSFKAGSIIYGTFTAIDIASGTCIAYNI